MKNKVVLFYSNTCEPCRHQKPLLEEIAKDLKLTLELVSLDEPESAAFAHNFGVRSFPHTLFVVDDIVKEEMLGYDLSKPKEENKINILNTLKQLKFF